MATVVRCLEYAEKASQIYEEATRLREAPLVAEDKQIREQLQAVAQAAQELRDTASTPIKVGILFD